MTGFDPEGLERAAKAARELDSSRNASSAIELIKAQEATKQHEAAAKRSEMDAYAQQLRQANIEAEANEARKTLDAQTEHERRRAEYQDQLERKRQVDMLNAQKYMQEYVCLVNMISGSYFCCGCCLVVGESVFCFAARRERLYCRPSLSSPSLI